MNSSDYLARNFTNAQKIAKIIFILQKFVILTAILAVIDVARKLNLDFDGVWELIKASYSAVSVPSGEDEFELIPWVSSL